MLFPGFSALAQSCSCLVPCPARLLPWSAVQQRCFCRPPHQGPLTPRSCEYHTRSWCCYLLPTLGLHCSCVGRKPGKGRGSSGRACGLTHFQAHNPHSALLFLPMQPRIVGQCRPAALAGRHCSQWGPPECVCGAHGAAERCEQARPSPRAAPAAYDTRAPECDQGGLREHSVDRGPSEWDQCHRLAGGCCRCRACRAHLLGHLAFFLGPPMPGC